MGSVDLADQLVTYYGFENRSQKWWKVFFFLVEVAIVDSYILYCEQNPNKKTSWPPPSSLPTCCQADREALPQEIRIPEGL